MLSSLTILLFVAAQDAPFPPPPPLPTAKQNLPLPPLAPLSSSPDQPPTESASIDPDSSKKIFAYPGQVVAVNENSKYPTPSLVVLAFDPKNEEVEIGVLRTIVDAYPSAPMGVYRIPLGSRLFVALETAVIYDPDKGNKCSKIVSRFAEVRVGIDTSRDGGVPIVVVNKGVRITACP